MTAFFSRARTAATIGTLLFFVALFPYFFLTGDSSTANARRAGCLLPPTCLALGTVVFVEYEDSGEVHEYDFVWVAVRVRGGGSINNCFEFGRSKRVKEGW